MASLKQVARVFQAFLEKLDRWTRPKDHTPQDGLIYWQERMIFSILLTGVILGLAAYIPSVQLLIKEGKWLVVALDTAIYAFWLYIFWGRQLPLKFRAYSIIGAIYILGMVIIMLIGPAASGPSWLFAFPIIAGVILGVRAAFTALGVNALSLIFIGVMIKLDAAPWLQPAALSLAPWVVTSLNFIMLNALAAVPLSMALKGLESSLTHEKAMRQSVQQQMDERMQAEERLQSLSTMVEQSIDAIIHTDTDFKITYMNRAAEELFGYPLAELQGQTPGVLNAEPDAETIQQDIYAALSAGKTYFVELLNKRRNGETFICEMKASPLKSSQGEITGYMASQRDITQQRKTEQALKQSEAKYRHLFENAPVGIFRTTASGNVLDVNPEMARIVGFDNKEEAAAYYTNMAVQLYVDPARRAEFVRQMRQSGYVDNFEYQAYCRDGKKIWIAMNARISEYSSANKFIIEGFALDITRRKQYEQELLEYQMAVENSGELMAVVDNNDIYRMVNTAYANMLGLPKEQIIGQPLEAILGSEMTHNTIKPYLEQCLAGETVNYESRRYYPNIGGLYMAISYYPLRDSNQIKGVVAILRDITEYKEAEAELIESREKLRRLSGHLEEVREKERIEIARILHDELGQALTGLRIDILQLEKKLKFANSELAESISPMLDLLDYINDKAKEIVSDLRPGMLDDLGLIPALEWHIDNFMQRTGIQSNFSTNTPEQDLADETATGIYRICQEALSNVYRHAAANLVEVELTAGSDQLALEIRDDGIGIDPRAIDSPDSFGLMGMRERARALGGILAVDRDQSAGTSVKLQVPVESQSRPRI